MKNFKREILTFSQNDLHFHGKYQPHIMFVLGSSLRDKFCRNLAKISKRIFRAPRTHTCVCYPFFFWVILQQIFRNSFAFLSWINGTEKLNKTQLMYFYGFKVTRFFIKKFFLRKWAAIFKKAEFFLEYLKSCKIE